MFRYLFIFCFVLSATLYWGCNSCNKPNPSADNQDIFAIEGLADGSFIPIGNSLFLKINPIHSKIKIDSVLCVTTGYPSTLLMTAPFNYSIVAEGKVGNRNISVTVFYESGKSQTKNILVSFLSDIEPEQLTKTVINTYVHPAGLFTEGFEYKDGMIYEGTGLEGKSKLLQYSLSTAKITKTIDLPSQYFGEGIALFDDKIIQLTWKNGAAFLYNQNDFSKLGEIRYGREGWGITYSGKELLASDGSNTIYFLNPKDLTEESRITVYDNKGPVANLNELELIEGVLFANIWQTDKIARIDTATGKVLSYIDCGMLLTQFDLDAIPDIDVLNGIAYDSQRKRILVTGKNWPRIFEIRLSNKAL